MFQRISKSIWLVILLVAVVLGSLPGVALGQGHNLFLGMIIGWFSIPLMLYQLITGTLEIFSPTDALFWPTLLILLIYPIAMLGYGACAYWTAQRTGIVREGLKVVVVAAFVSALVSIPMEVILTNSFSNFARSNFASYLAGMLVAHGFILVHLLISALLGGLIAAGLVRLGRLNRPVVS
ncbi:MAG TPA: hypothetical protein VHZ51_15565 [Ktedonobacteraceae bacterium]|nr:hypothetical protein [Ktedonobacteraceae bacterium]